MQSGVPSGSYGEPSGSYTPGRIYPENPDRIDLWVRFFGGFEVFGREGLLNLGRSDRATSIFKYLLANRPHPVSQDSLMALLWPETSPQKARWSLNSAVYTLRKALSNELPRLQKPVPLERGHYTLSREISVASDVERFDELHERGRIAERRRVEPEAILAYESAVKLYQGDYLVEDLYEDWTMIERERLMDAYVSMLAKLANYCASSGELENSIQLRYRILEKDSYHEESYRALMTCYAQLGLRSRALEHYKLCRHMLEVQYGIPPSPETQALNRSILRGHDV